MRLLPALLALFAALQFAPIPALASTDPVADTRQILAGTVTTKSVKQAYLSGAKDSTTAFQGALTAYKAVRAAEPALTVTCADGTVVKAPGVCPKAPPPPPPIPTPQLVIPDVGQLWCPTATNLCHTETATPSPAGWTEAPLAKGGYARPLNLLYCAGAIVKIEALDANGYLNEPLLADWTGKSFDPGPDRVWAVHFVNDAGGKCADTGWTVVMFTHDLEGIAPAP